MLLLREKYVVDVVLTRKICRFKEKRSRYYEKICRFNEKRSRYYKKRSRYYEKRSRYNEKRSRYYEKRSRYNEKRSRYNEKRSGKNIIWVAVLCHRRLREKRDHAKSPQIYPIFTIVPVSLPCHV